jgi:hypothetical protein
MMMLKTISACLTIVLLWSELCCPAVEFAHLNLMHNHGFIAKLDQRFGHREGPVITQEAQQPAAAPSMPARVCTLMARHLQRPQTCTKATNKNKCLHDC